MVDHPHRKQLEATFQDMQALSKEFDFGVWVILAPSAARLYGSQFENFPHMSDRPYFLDFVEELARKMEFKTINLLPLLQTLCRERIVILS